MGSTSPHSRIRQLRMHLGRKPSHSSLRFLKSILQGRNRNAPAVGGGVGDGRVHPSSSRTKTTTNKAHNAKLTLKEDVAILTANNQMQIKNYRRYGYYLCQKLLFRCARGPELNLVAGCYSQDFRIDQHTSIMQAMTATRSNIKYKITE